MNRSNVFRRALAVMILCLAAVSVAAQQHEEHEQFKNLKVLPKDISDQDLHNVMRAFTRGLGVRCGYCHALPQGKPPEHDDFAKDDKPAKEKARAMMRMVDDINSKYLANLEHRADPPVRVQCATCHHGVAVPRQLQDVLQAAYDQGGMDSTTARYQSLRDRYYGSAAYDFGEVPLSDVATNLRDQGKTDDQLKLLALNVEMNPKSQFAKRQHAGATIMQAFKNQGVDAGNQAYQTMKTNYGPAIVSEQVVNDVGHQLLFGDKTPEAIAVFKLVVADNPQSSDAQASLGDAYAKHGDKKLAIEAYSKSLELDANNEAAKQGLDALKAKPKKPSKKK